MSKELEAFLLDVLKKVLEKYPLAESGGKVLAFLVFHVISHLGIYKALIKTVAFPTLPASVPASYFVSAFFYLVNYLLSLIFVLKGGSVVPKQTHFAGLGLGVLVELLADHYATRNLISSTGVMMHPSWIKFYKQSIWRLALVDNRMAQGPFPYPLPLDSLSGD